VIDQHRNIRVHTRRLVLATLSHVSAHTCTHGAHRPLLVIPSLPIACTKRPARSRDKYNVKACYDVAESFFVLDCPDATTLSLVLGPSVSWWTMGGWGQDVSFSGACVAELKCLDASFVVLMCIHVGRRRRGCFRRRMRQRGTGGSVTLRWVRG
jgi:hypothetical protein